MSWIKKFISSFVLISISIIFGFLFIEAAYRLVSDNTEKQKYFQRTMLFEAGKNFINKDDIFRYFPNKKIKSVAIYTNLEQNEGVKEYDYYIQTNNLGLVMKNNVYQRETIHLFIGNSFTEGQGATPWFYGLENNWKNVYEKPVNGGILGTGPMQWLDLTKQIESEIKPKINTITILLLLPDLYRPKWNFSEQRMLDCLYNAVCSYSREFQGYKFGDKKDDEIISDVLHANNTLDVRYPTKPLTINNFSDLLIYLKSKSQVVNKIDNMFYQRQQLQNNQIIKDNLKALSELILMSSKTNLILINTKDQADVPMSDIVENTFLGKIFNSWASRLNLSYNTCDIPKEYFHTYDGHPNELGYKYLKNCVTGIINL